MISNREVVYSRAPVSWILPAPLLLFAGVVDLRPLASLVHRPVSLLRCVGDAFAVTLALIAAVWLWVRPRSDR